MFQLEDIELFAGQSNILSIPDLKVTGQQPVMISGSSGSGKTSLLQVMAALRKADKGHVFFQDGDLQALNERQRDEIRGQNFGFVFQGLHLIKHLSVYENIILPFTALKKQPIAGNVQTVCQTLGLQGKETQKAASLSQGEAQRVAIARAIVHRPRVIFADEPTSSLDDKNANAVISLLEKQASETGALLIVATHDNRIKKRFDRIINIESGRISP